MYLQFSEVLIGTKKQATLKAAWGSRDRATDRYLSGMQPTWFNSQHPCIHPSTIGVLPMQSQE